VPHDIRIDFRRAERYGLRLLSLLGAVSFRWCSGMKFVGNRRNGRSRVAARQLLLE
jgi:hypothetical protein